MNRYVKPKSLAWWVSIVPLVAGCIKAVSVVYGPLTPIAVVIDEASGGKTPLELIQLGLLGIGLRGAMG